jgi:hypothetical protein
MPKVNIKSDSKYSAKETYEKVKSLLSNDADLKKLDPSFACTFDDSTMTGVAKGGMFKADMKVEDKSPTSSVEIIVDLPFHLALVKGMVKKTLEKKLIKELG